MSLKPNEQVTGVLQAYFSGALLEQINKQLDQIENPSDDTAELGVKVTTSQNISSSVEKEVMNTLSEFKHIAYQKQRVYRIIDNFYTTLPQKKKDILKCRHSELLKWDDVAAQTNYSEKQCRNINKDLIFALGMKLSTLTNFF